MQLMQSPREKKKRRLKNSQKLRSRSQAASEYRSTVFSVDFLHLRGLLVRSLHLLERRQVIITRIVVVVDAQAKLDHSVDAPGELRRLIQGEARRQQRRVEQEPNEI